MLAFVVECLRRVLSPNKYGRFFVRSPGRHWGRVRTRQGPTFMERLHIKRYFMYIEIGIMDSRKRKKIYVY